MCYCMRRVEKEARQGSEQKTVLMWARSLYRPKILNYNKNYINIGHVCVRACVRACMRTWINVSIGGVFTKETHVLTWLICKYK